MCLMGIDRWQVENKRHTSPALRKKGLWCGRPFFCSFYFQYGFLFYPKVKLSYFKGSFHCCF